jgi:hypothetical protein
VLGSAAISIAILILAPNKLSPSEVFGNIQDGSGWNSKGFSFLIGYLSVEWVGRAKIRDPLVRLGFRPDTSTRS